MSTYANWELELLYDFILQYLWRFLRSLNSYLTVAIALERNIAAYYPLKCKTNNDDSRKRRYIYILYVAIATAMAFFASRPMFESNFLSVINSNTHYIEWLYSIEKLVLSIIVPMTAMIGFNLALYTKIKSKQYKSSADNVALAIICVSVLCTLPSIATFVINLSNLDCECQCEMNFGGMNLGFSFPIISIANGFEITFSYFNSAANFLILYFYGSKFGMIFQQKWQKVKDFIINKLFGCYGAQ